MLTGSLRANSYYLKTALNRKADMHRMLETYVQREGATSILARALPETHIIDLHELEVHVFIRHAVPKYLICTSARACILNAVNFAGGR